MLSSAGDDNVLSRIEIATLGSTNDDCRAEKRIIKRVDEEENGNMNVDHKTTKGSSKTPPRVTANDLALPCFPTMGDLRVSKAPASPDDEYADCGKPSLHHHSHPPVRVHSSHHRHISVLHDRNKTPSYSDSTQEEGKSEQLASDTPNFEKENEKLQTEEQKLSHFFDLLSKGITVFKYQRSGSFRRVQRILWLGYGGRRLCIHKEKLEDYDEEIDDVEDDTELEEEKYTITESHRSEEITNERNEDQSQENEKSKELSPNEPGTKRHQEGPTLEKGQEQTSPIRTTSSFGFPSLDSPLISSFSSSLTSTFSSLSLPSPSSLLARSFSPRSQLDGPKGIYLRDLSDVRAGAKSAAFQKCLEEGFYTPSEDRCFSLISSERSLDLEVPSKEIRDELVKRFALLIQFLRNTKAAEQETKSAKIKAGATGPGAITGEDRTEAGTKSENVEADAEEHDLCLVKQFAEILMRGIEVQKLCTNGDTKLRVLWLGLGGSRIFVDQKRKSHRDTSLSSSPSVHTSNPSSPPSASRPSEPGIMSPPRMFSFTRKPWGQHRGGIKGIDVEDITEIRTGLNSATVIKHHVDGQNSPSKSIAKRKPAKRVSMAQRDMMQRCLSIIGSERTIDIIFPSVELRDAFTVRMKLFLRHRQNDWNKGSRKMLTDAQQLTNPAGEQIQDGAVSSTAHAPSTSENDGNNASVRSPSALASPLTSSGLYSTLLPFPNHDPANEEEEE